MRSLAILLSLAMVTSAAAQQPTPTVGYVYPAGGRKGTALDVILGGTNLANPRSVTISGGGVTAEVVEHFRPANPGELNRLRPRVEELLKKKRAAGWKPMRPNAPLDDSWTDEDERELADTTARMQTVRLTFTTAPALLETVTVRVTISPDAQPGLRQLRLLTNLGLTSPIAFQVGQLPEFVAESQRDAVLRESRELGPRARRPTEAPAGVSFSPGAVPTSTAPEVETDVEIPVVLNGQILPGDVDRYRFRARKGEHLVVDVSARELIPYISDAVPGWFQATVALFDAQGEEIAYEDDFRFDPDPILHCEIPSDGEYVLEIRDAIFRGREDFVYRVAVGELPLVTDVFPRGCRAEAETTFRLSGWNLSKTEVTRAFPRPGTRQLAVVQDPGYIVSVPIAVNMLPETFETESNDDRSAAQDVLPPTIINGRIDTPQDVDVFSFRCRAGTQVAAEVFARRLGSPLDSVLKLTDAAGNELASNDDHEDPASGRITHHADSRMSVTTPHTGRYYLHLADSQQHGGDDHSYRLRVAIGLPDFQLRMVPSSVTTRPGTAVPITIHAIRQNGFDGEIRLVLDRPPPGFVLGGGRIPAGTDVIRATLSVPPRPTKGPVSLSILGTTWVDGRRVTRPAAAADDQMQAFIYRHLVPANDFQVMVTGAARRFYSPSAPIRQPIEIPAGGTIDLPLSLPRKITWAKIFLELDDPPDGITLKEGDLAKLSGGMELLADAEHSEVGLEGNLLVRAVIEREQRGSTMRIPVTYLPAIPFRIVDEAAEPAADAAPSPPRGLTR